MYRSLRLCSNRGGYESVADPPAPIDLARARDVLAREGIPFLDARVMLIARMEVEVTVSRGGRLLFKTQDRRLAERTFERLRALLQLPGVDGPGGPETGHRRD